MKRTIGRYIVETIGCFSWLSRLHINLTIAIHTIPTEMLNSKFVFLTLHLECYCSNAISAGLMTIRYVQQFWNLLSSKIVVSYKFLCKFIVGVLLMCKLWLLWNLVFKPVGNHPPLSIYLSIVNNNIPTTKSKKTNL